MHIEHITHKALTKLGFLKRLLYLASHDTRLCAYISLIQATLDYASIIWNPHTAILSNCIESIQNKAARFILRSYSPYQSVSALKQILNLPDLSTRRKFFRLTFCTRFIMVLHLFPVLIFSQPIMCPIVQSH